MLVTLVTQRLYRFHIQNRLLMFMHINNGYCQKCREIINRYPNFYPPLLKWFATLQKSLPEAHVSCAGRGQMDQEACFLRGVSRAHWTKSAHNWNAALDLFKLDEKDKTNLYDKEFFKEIQLSVPEWIDWYGRADAKFKEFPHFEVKDWHELKDMTLQLVE